MIQETLAKVVQKIDLQEGEMPKPWMRSWKGRPPGPVGGFLAALRMKGRTVEEVTAAARIMRQKVTRIDARSFGHRGYLRTAGRDKRLSTSPPPSFVVAAAA